jgi:acyl-homoserine lactone synthase
MLIIANRQNRDRHSGRLDEMHRLRKRVFVDRLGWDVPVANGEFEIDQFDGDAAEYFLVIDRASGALAGSVRLMPSTSPHLLGELFSFLCEGAPPVGPHIWEITRQCYNDALPRDAVIRARHQITCGLLEYGLMRGIERYTLVTNVEHVPMLMTPGWTCTPLGMPQWFNDELIAPMAIDVSQSTLDDIRERFGGRRPVISAQVLELAN